MGRAASPLGLAPPPYPERISRVRLPDSSPTVPDCPLGHFGPSQVCTRGLHGDRDRAHRLRRSLAQCGHTHADSRGVRAALRDSAYIRNVRASTGAVWLAPKDLLRASPRFHGASASSVGFALGHGCTLRVETWLGKTARQITLAHLAAGLTCCEETWLFGSKAG